MRVNKGRKMDIIFIDMERGRLLKSRRFFKTLLGRIEGGIIFERGEKGWFFKKEVFYGKAV